MKRAFISLVLLLSLMAGCAEYGRAEFNNIVQNHRKLVERNVKDCIAGIQDDLVDVGPSLTPEERAKVDDLILRLNIMAQQSATMEKFVMSHADEQLIADMMRLRWKEAKEN